MAQGRDWFERFLTIGIEFSRRVAHRNKEFPRQPEVLIEIVQEFLSKDNRDTPVHFKIIFHPRNYDANDVRGKIEIYHDRAEIFYDFKKQSYCWRRFTVVKELCHLLYWPLGTGGMISTPEEVKQLISNLMVGLENVDFYLDEVASTEQVAVLMALEILLPHSERTNVDVLIANGKSLREIAEKYRIPLHMLQFYLTPSYSKLIEHAYGVYRFALSLQ
ncbi:MAG: hypothetical protein QM813_21525 [Verrucomicrobiota bacterium]